MTTKLTTRNNKSRFSSGNNVQNTTANDGDLKTSRINVKKPLSTTLLQSNSPANGLSTHLKKRTFQINNFLHSKLKSNHSNETQCSQPSSECSKYQPHVLHTIPSTSSEKSTKSPKLIIDEQKANNEPTSPSDFVLNRAFRHTVIKALSTDSHSSVGQSSHSDEDDNQSKFYPVLSSIDADIDQTDESNDDSNKKARRLQRTRRTSVSSTQQKNENKTCKDEQQSSSDENKIKDSKVPLNGHSERRIKSGLAKRYDHTTHTAQLTATTTDDDSKRHQNHHHALEHPESKLKPKHELNGSSIPTPNVPTHVPSVKKTNRFLVKPIRKSQQSQVLLTPQALNTSSHDEDYSASNGHTHSSLEPSSHARHRAQTSCTDVENSTSHIKHKFNGGISTHTSIENEHRHVHFQGSTRGKQESAGEEEKSSNHVATTGMTSVPVPTTQSSANSAQGEDDDEEEEAIGKSPDNRFIKYAKEIGRGAFKTVYRGLDTETSVPVAWCELQDFAQFNKHERTRFKEEAEMLKKLQHPNIVRFYDFWEETNPRTNKKVIILVTELMTSGSLKGYIRNFKGQKEEKRINVMKKWCRQILKGLAYLHSRNPPVIHRDLKCDNVFISSTTGCVKIGDLGLATFKTQTFAKSMRGTMEFMAPEMFDEKYDELVDIYSFGLCMLEMITGEYPYLECKGPAVIKRIRAGSKPDCYYRVENEDVREVIDCCIRTNKEERLPVNELLQHSFFLEDIGLRIDFVRDPTNDLQVMVTNNSINLKLKIVDKGKRKAVWTEHEAILFRYNLTTDTPEQIADELIEKNYIFEDDKKFLIQSIKDRVRAYQYEQIDRKAGVFFVDGKQFPNQTSQPSSFAQPQQTVPPQQPASPPVQHQTVPPPLQQPSITPPAQQQPVSPPVLQQPTATPLVAQTQVPMVNSVTPTPTSVSPSPPEVQQQQQQANIKPPTENPLIKPMPTTEPLPIPVQPLPDHNSNVATSGASLEILDLALKKTFNKGSTPLGTSVTSSSVNDSTEIPMPVGNQEDPSLSRLGHDNVAVDQQQQQQQQQQPPKDESGGMIAGDSTTNIFQATTQPPSATIVNTHQQPILQQNPLLLTQSSQSYPYTAISPTPHLITSILSSEPIKITVPSSSTVTETVDNSILSASPSYGNDIIQSSLPSDTQATAQPAILCSLEQLDALLKNTFKGSGKATGSTQSSDTETTTVNVPSIPITIGEENSTNNIEIEPDLTCKSDEKMLISTSTLPVFPHPESILPSVVPLIPSQPITSQLEGQLVAHIDSSSSSIERAFPEADTAFVKTSNNRPLPNDDSFTAVSSKDLTEIKMMINNINTTLVTRMSNIEHKIDVHNNQATQINNVLTRTVLPTFIELASIIYEIPHSDPRIRTKLDEIQHHIESVQQQKTLTMQDMLNN